MRSRRLYVEPSSQVHRGKGPRRDERADIHANDGSARSIVWHEAAARTASTIHLDTARYTAHEAPAAAALSVDVGPVPPLLSTSPVTLSTFTPRIFSNAWSAYSRRTSSAVRGTHLSGVDIRPPQFRSHWHV